MDLGKIAELEKKANWTRQQTLEMCAGISGGHLASSFSCIDILVALYYGGILRFDPANPDWDERDRLIVSKGHGAIGLYPILSDLGFFSGDELSKFCQGGSTLGSHPDHLTPGIEVITGSLGHGLGLATGLALGARMDGKGYMTVALLGDGECYEGSVWEAAMFAGHQELNNLVAVIDRNQLCAIDFTEDCLRLNPLEDKWRAFRWEVKSISGHSFEEISSAFKNFCSRRSNKPLMIIANTTKAKGISFMENNPLAHTLIPSGEQLERAREEIK